MSFFNRLGYFLERNVVDNYLIAKYDRQAKKEKEEERRFELLHKQAQKLMESAGFTAEEAVEALDVSDMDKEILLKQLLDSH